MTRKEILWKNKYLLGKIYAFFSKANKAQGFTGVEELRRVTLIMGGRKELSGGQ